MHMTANLICLFNCKPDTVFSDCANSLLAILMCIKSNIISCKDFKDCVSCKGHIFQMVLGQQMVHTVFLKWYLLAIKIPSS